MSDLRTYKMTHATGFAPNFDGGILTLATCKPGIREKANVGDFIAGFTSKKLGKTGVGEEKLIYLMEVTEKLTFAKYWEKYPQKRTDANALGDNIYRPLASGGYRQVENSSHDESDLNRDLSSEYVLISTRFKYFGKADALDISKFRAKLNIPKVQTRFGCKNDMADLGDFIEFVMKSQATPDIDYKKVKL